MAVLTRPMAALTAVFCAAYLSATATNEYAVKAAYLANLFSYVQWPAGQATAQTLCVLGPDPFGRLLEETLDRYHTGVKVRRLGEGQNPNRDCSILFIASGTPKRLSPVVAGASHAGVLTVSEAEEPPGLAGIVILDASTADQRVRIVIRLDEAEELGFRISSRLLAISRLVRRPGAL